MSLDVPRASVDQLGKAQDRVSAPIEAPRAIASVGDSEVTDVIPNAAVGSTLEVVPVNFDGPARVLRLDEPELRCPIG